MTKEKFVANCICFVVRPEDQEFGDKLLHLFDQLESNTGEQAFGQNRKKVRDFLFCHKKEFGSAITESVLGYAFDKGIEFFIQVMIG